MKRPLLLTTALLTSGLLLAGCAAKAAESDTQTTVPRMVASESLSDEIVDDYDLSPSAVMAANHDYTTVNEDEWSESDAVEVKLSGTGVAGSVTGVSSSGGTVTVTQAGVYRLSGALNGQLRVDAPEDALVVLLLDGVTIANAKGSAIEVVSADDVEIHLAAGSENEVSDAASYAADAEANAAIWADTDLTISGEGSLTVKANGNDGITSKDDLVVLGGTISVAAADDALRGKDALVVEGGTLTLAAYAGDGMKSDGDDGKASAEIDWTRGYVYLRGGTIDITAGDDGIQAFTDAIIAAGDVTIAAEDDGVKGEVTASIGLRGGAEASTAPRVTVTKSTEGIEAANVGISAGQIEVTASDDGVNASGNADLQALIAGEEFTGVADREADSGERLEITGGTVTVLAGSDGLDSNGTITVSGGQVTISSAANGGDGPIDGNGTVEVADGVVTANGAAWDASMAGPMGGGMSPGGAGGPGAPGAMPGGSFGGGQARPE